MAISGHVSIHLFYPRWMMPVGRLETGSEADTCQPTRCNMTQEFLTDQVSRILGRLYTQQSLYPCQVPSHSGTLQKSNDPLAYSLQP